MVLGYLVSCRREDGPHVYDPDIVGCYLYFKTPATDWQLSEMVAVEEDAGQGEYPHIRIRSA